MVTVKININLYVLLLLTNDKLTEPDSLIFVRRKNQYQAYFQSGLKKIFDEDYDNIIANTSEPRDALSFVIHQNNL
jgi:hypothetical protein